MAKPIPAPSMMQQRIYSVVEHAHSISTALQQYQVTKMNGRPSWEVRGGQNYAVFSWSADDQQWVVEPGNSLEIADQIRQSIDALFQH